nr:alpha/beta hydrolase [Paracoccus suum]
MEADVITDWEDAWANGPHIPGGAEYPARWAQAAADFRSTAIMRDGIFWPEGTPKGLAVVIHGGWWVRFSPDDWSHLAAGALARGWAVLIPRYTLAPGARIAQIGQQVAGAIAAAAAQIAGPVVLTGHSAGGHLTARMVSAQTPLPPEVLTRVARTVPVSGLFDLRPLMRLAVNAQLQIDPAEAMAESPPLLGPASLAPMIVWVGAAERTPFLWQSRAMAATWALLGAPTRLVEERGRHHFDIVEGLTDPTSQMTEALVGGL